jgi:ADP-heptose:LPS heptosyltransferase
MNVVKKIISLGYGKQILPFQTLRNPDRILVLFPLKFFTELAEFTPAIELLRSTFDSAKIIGVIQSENVLFFERSGFLDQVVSYESKPFYPSRQFFRLKRKLRAVPASMSIDFSLDDDLLSWIGGAPLRIGSQSSAFINYEVRLPERDQAKAALRLVKAICTVH